MVHQNFEKQVIELYGEILLREPDKTGLYYFVSQLESKKMTLDDVRNSLMTSEEGKSIQNYSHYTDKYWNNLPVVKKYKNRLSTDNEDIHWLDDITNRFGNFLPFENVLIVGCGNGWLERQLYDMNIGIHFDAFDISDRYLKEAESKKETRSITYFIDDINNLKPICSTCNKSMGTKT